MTPIYDEYQQRLHGSWIDTQGHLQFLHETVLKYKKPVVIELGVHVGNTTSALLSGVELSDGELWSCDIDDVTKKVPTTFTQSPRWRFFHGDDVGEQILSQLPKQCDVLFIDTSHTYEHTLAELEAYIPRVKSDGVALLHDTHYAGWALPELPAPTGAVGQALSKYCQDHGLTWEDRYIIPEDSPPGIDGPGFFGLGILRIT